VESIEPNHAPTLGGGKILIKGNNYGSSSTEITAYVGTNACTDPTLIDNMYVPYLSCVCKVQCMQSMQSTQCYNVQCMQSMQSMQCYNVQCLQCAMYAMYCSARFIKLNILVRFRVGYQEEQEQD
jgi:hypothetical protein